MEELLELHRMVEVGYLQHRSCCRRSTMRITSVAIPV